MKVRAKFRNGGFGFYASFRRYDGDEFTINPEHFSESWMEKLEEEVKPAPKKRGRKPKVVEETVEETNDSDNELCESEE